MPWVNADLCNGQHREIYLEDVPTEGGWRNRNIEGHQHYIVVYDPCCGPHKNNELRFLDRCIRE